MQSYLSACSSKFSNIEMGNDNPPESSIAPIQAWTKVSKASNQTASTYSSLTASNDGEKFQKMEEENRRLLIKVNELSKQVQVLLAQKDIGVSNKTMTKNFAQEPTVDLRQVPQPSIDFLIDKVMERLQTCTEEDSVMQEINIPSPLDTSFDLQLTPNPK